MIGWIAVQFRFSRAASLIGGVGSNPTSPTLRKTIMIPYHIRLMYLENAAGRQIGSMLFNVYGNFVTPYIMEKGGKTVNPLKLSLEIEEMEDYKYFIGRYVKNDP